MPLAAPTSSFGSLLKNRKNMWTHFVHSILLRVKQPLNVGWLKKIAGFWGGYRRISLCINHVMYWCTHQVNIKRYSSTGFLPRVQSVFNGRITVAATILIDYISAPGCFEYDCWLCMRWRIRTEHPPYINVYIGSVQHTIRCTLELHHIHWACNHPWRLGQWLWCLSSTKLYIIRRVDGGSLYRHLICTLFAHRTRLHQW